MELFQIWLMPENKEKGSHDKWKELEPVEAQSRKQVVESCHKKYKLGTWKVRKI